MAHSSLQTQKAFVLHSRPYRDTSVLLEILTESAGRINAVARGARGTRSPLRGRLQPFTPLWISWSGKGDLVSLRSAEPSGEILNLQQRRLVDGLYLNELLIRLLHRGDPSESIFCLYEKTLFELNNIDSSECVVLRRFEKCLLDELGYGLPLQHEAHSSAPIIEDRWYRFSLQEGFVMVDVLENIHQHSVFKGAHLLSIDREDYSSREVVADAKRLMRLVLTPLLGERPIKSRELLMSSPGPLSSPAPLSFPRKREPGSLLLCHPRESGDPEK